MSEILQPEQSSQLPATPDTLHNVALAAWQGNLDAVRDDELPYGGQSLRLYPTDTPRDSILIFPVMGHTSMEDGTFRLLRRSGAKTTGLLDVMTTDDGKRLVSSLRSSDLSSAMEIAPVEDEAIARMQLAISEASPTRPVGALARILGRITARQ